MEVSDILEEDSGSAYEASSSHEDRPARTDSRQSRRQSRGRSTTAAAKRSRVARSASSNGSSSPDSVMSSRDTPRIRQDAAQWAAGFQRLESPDDIELPSRQPFGSREKRKIGISATEIRAKRLKVFHSKEYRELLNTEIHHAGLRTIPEDNAFLESSQIGASIWTSDEKNLLFSALSRLGRDEVHGIAIHVGTKSELQVQEYIHILQKATKERNSEDRRKQHTISFTDYPAALEISYEGCSILERAANALACRQESFEEQREEDKWGDIWLLDFQISRWLEKRRKTEEGEEEIEATLPAANLFNCKNWLTLSHRIFMNPASPRESENWQILAEPGETPAIRTTALEDLHSLAVSVTKRLLSATLFCAQTRLRSMNAKKIKHAEISQDDVEAAAKMLRLKLNSGEFWRRCPRRCNLEVFDDEQDEESGDQGDMMTYDEVELALGGEVVAQSRSQSESASHHEYSGRSASSVGEREDSEDLTDSLSAYDDPYSNDDLLHTGGSELEYERSLESTNIGLAGLSKRRREARQKIIEEAKANKQAQEEYTEAYDQEANTMEEQRLWTLLKQTPPLQIKLESIEMPGRPKTTENEVVEPDWRDNLEYWSQWETLPTPISSKDFERKDERSPRRAMRGACRARPEPDISSSASHGELEGLEDEPQPVLENFDISDSSDDRDGDAAEEVPDNLDNRDIDDSGDSSL